MMINTEKNGSAVADVVTATPAHDKLLPVPKKMALRDVQNENGRGKLCGDTVKVCGNKRLTPERPSSSQGLPFLAINDTNENVMNARRRFELELGSGRFQNNVQRITKFSESKNVEQVKPNNVQKLTRDGNVHQGKQSNSIPFDKISPAPACAIDYKSTHHLLSIETERFISLQGFLKKCDEAYRIKYSQMFMHLSPLELNNHAIDLERKAIQLTIAEGNEIKRMKALNLSPGNNLLKSTQFLEQNKL